MASGSQFMTTYYAKRIMGDNAASTADQALLQTGYGITTDTWILNRTNRPNYGILYHYDSNGADKIKFIGGINNTNDIETAWIQLDAGDTYILGRVGIGEDPTINNNPYKLYINGTTYTNAPVYINNSTAVAMEDDNGALVIGDKAGLNIGIDNCKVHARDNSAAADLLLNSEGGNILLGVDDNDYYVNIRSEQDASSTSTGALRIGGGAGIAKKLYIGDDIHSDGHLYFAAAKNIYMNYNGVDYPILENSDDSNIILNAATGILNIGYANTTFVDWMNGRMQLKDGCLSIFPNNSNYREGIRIHSTGSWSDITLCGDDNTGDSGISANSWFIGNNNGNFYIARNGSPGSTAYIGCISNVWKFVTAADIPEGAANLSVAATAHTLSIYRNGITIPYQMDNANDGGILRVRGTTESNCILELGTWDDSGAGETIQFNYYPTTSQVTPTYSVSVPKHSGTLVTTDGHGASGTWGISISGNAATATTASKLGTNAGNANTPVYFSGGVPVATNNKLGAQKANGYWGMGTAENNFSDWIRTTSSGIIPYQSGGASAGHCGLGTSSWYFSYAYIQNIYGYLHGNISGSSASCTGNAATATKATQDSSGHTITSYYCTLSTAQTFTGAKTFNTTCYFANGTTYYVNNSGDSIFNTSKLATYLVVGSTTKTAHNSEIEVYFNNVLGAKITANTNSGFAFQIFNTSGTQTGRASRSSGAWGTVSSREVKHDIVPLPDVGVQVDALVPVSFKYKEGDQTTQLGLIYEDTVDILPEICEDAEGTKTINYSALTPVLLRELQSLRKRVKQLEELLLTT